LGAVVGTAPFAQKAFDLAQPPMHDLWS
jgi:hypothetical protein